LLFRHLLCLVVLLVGWISCFFLGRLPW
jgi:hypothetical protein